MPTPVRVLTSDPPLPDNVGVSQPVQPSEVNTIEKLFIPKADFANGAEPTVCYVIDGGDSTGQPCDA